MPSINESRNAITQAFKSFGYTPSKEEVDQLLSIGTARGDSTAKVFGSVANYVRTVRLQQERKQNDPLNQVIADERGFFSETEKRTADLEGNLEGPVKLFGALDENQVQQYLAPLTQSTLESGARLQGAAGRRGLGGSSTEMNALAENERKFKENVLTTGLQTGMDERTRLTQLLMQQYGLSAGSLQRQAGIAGQQSAAALDESQTLSELPIYLRGISAQETAVEEAINARESAAKKAKQAGIARLIGTSVGAVGGALLALPIGGMSVPMGAALGSTLGSSLGGSVYGDAGSDPSSALLALMMMQQRQPRSNFIGGGTYNVQPGTHVTSDMAIT